jgi:hypothetical protein
MGRAIARLTHTVTVTIADRFIAKKKLPKLTANRKQLNEGEAVS